MEDLKIRNYRKLLDDDDQIGPICELFESFLPVDSKLTAVDIRVDLWESLEAGREDCLDCDVVFAMGCVMDETCEDLTEEE